jgi:hypothetical protein
MKKNWLLIAFIFVANLVLADCFLANSDICLTLENERAKEIFGLTAEETADSEVYKEVISHIKERFSIDIEKDIKQISFYLCKHNFIFVVNGNFDSGEMLTRINNLIETEKWRYQSIVDFQFCGNKYKALRINDHNLVFYDKNTLIFCEKKAENNDSIKISIAPDYIDNIRKTTNNYLFVSKEFAQNFRNFWRKSNLELEKANHFFLYVKNKELFVEAVFNDSSTAKEIVDKANNYFSKEYIEKLNQDYKRHLESSKENIFKLKKDLPDILYVLFESLYSQKNTDCFSSLKFLQSGNKVIISFDFDNVLSFITRGFDRFIQKDISFSMERIRDKCGDASKQKLNDLETFNTLYSNNLQKDIDYLREKIKKGTFADCLLISAILNYHTKANKIVFSNDNKESIASSKNQYDISYIVRSILTICLSARESAEKKAGKYLDFAESIDDLHQKMCFMTQRLIFGAVEMYNMDNDVKMTSLDIPLLEKKKYIRKIDEKCEYYSVGDLSKDGYVSCKIHGSFKKP